MHIGWSNPRRRMICFLLSWGAVGDGKMLVEGRNAQIQGSSYL